MWAIKKLAVWWGVIVFLAGMKWDLLLDLLTIVQMPLLPCRDLGKLKLKYMAILSHGASKIESGNKKPWDFYLLQLTFVIPCILRQNHAHTFSKMANKNMSLLLML